jgi:hypothetical protein
MDLRDRAWSGMDWNDQAYDRDQWKAFVNTVINIRVSYNLEIICCNSQ